MTAHVHDPATHGGGAPAPRATGVPQTTAARPRWLLPGVLVALVAGALVVAGVVSLSTVVYAGLFGGMILMHVGGHGHGGHGGAGRGDGGHAGGGNAGGGHGAGADEPGDLSRRSSGAQLSGSGSAAGLDDRATNEPTTSETEDHDQHTSHGCH